MMGARLELNSTLRPRVYEIAKVCVGIICSALAIWIVSRQVTLDQLVGVLERCQPVPIAIVVALVGVGVLARAARWQLLFLPERRVAFQPLLSTLTIGYMASTILPLRTGELVRGVLLAERADVAVPRVMGTILLEKLFDFLAIGVLLLVVLASVPLPPFALAAGASIASVIALGFGFVVALAVWRAPTLRFTSWFCDRLPASFTRRVPVVKLIADFAEGTDSLKVARLWPPLLGWTALAWILSPLTLLLGATAIGLSVPLSVAIFTVVVISTAMAVPSTPGYLGVYHATVVAAMVPFGISPADALGIAIIGHAFTYVPLVIAGVVILWVDGYHFGDLHRRPVRASSGLEIAQGVGPNAE